MNMEIEGGGKQANESSKYSNNRNEDISQKPLKSVLDSRDEAILSLVHSILDTDESLLDPSTQVQRDYLNMKHFLEYTLTNNSPAILQPVYKYSEFASNGVYLAPLPPRKSSLEQFMQSVTPNQEWNRSVVTKAEGVRNAPLSTSVHSVNDIAEDGDQSDSLSIIDISDTERDITMGVSSHLCLPSSNYYQSTNPPTTPAIIESQLRGFLGALHCEFDVTVVQRGFLLNYMMGGWE